LRRNRSEQSKFDLSVATDVQPSKWTATHLLDSSGVTCYDKALCRIIAIACDGQCQGVAQVDHVIDSGVERIVGGQAEVLEKLPDMDTIAAFSGRYPWFKRARRPYEM